MAATRPDEVQNGGEPKRSARRTQHPEEVKAFGDTRNPRKNAGDVRGGSGGGDGDGYFGEGGYAWGRDRPSREAHEDRGEEVRGEEGEGEEVEVEEVDGGRDGGVKEGEEEVGLQEDRRAVEAREETKSWNLGGWVGDDVPAGVGLKERDSFAGRRPRLFSSSDHAAAAVAAREKRVAKREWSLENWEEPEQAVGDRGLGGGGGVLGSSWSAVGVAFRRFLSLDWVEQQSER